ncbi:CD226 antigen [Eublepharis macularius]|uniref:CD226 antigen n=1 Tax=Eublepharis macularius TaxID=481883 RepID=A0AA97JNQ8_EUBMA|nr:CD226 antigen [Eublepharis macularius]
MHCLTLILITILQTCKGCFSVAEEGEPVDSTVKLTNNMTLKCVYPKIAKISLISWIKKSKGKETIAVFSLPHDLYINSTYKNRVSIVNNTVNDKSLVFNSTAEADIGLYVCSFQSFPFGKWEKKIRVVQSGNFIPPVSAASHVIIEPGRNVTFRCETDAVIAMNSVKWKRVQEDTVDNIVQCNLNSSVHGSDYQERVEVNCSTSANTVVLRNVTPSDAGIFCCCYIGASGESGDNWTKLTVTVDVPLDYKQTIFAVAGGAGAGAAVLLLMLTLSIVATVVHCRKKKRKRIVMPPKVPFTSNIQPYNSSRISAFHGPLNGSEGETTTAFATKEEAIYVNYQ